MITGLGGSSMMILCLCFVERNVVAAMTFITLAVTFTAFMFSGFNINYLDLSPNFAGVLMGLCNGMENVGTIIAPLYVGWVVSDLVSLLHNYFFTLLLYHVICCFLTL